jgi:Xaa-Pro dipeptidase
MPAVDYAARLRTLFESVEAEAIAIVPGFNMVYFTGLHFHLSERPTVALLTADGLSFIIPHLEMPKLHERPDLEGRAFAWKDEDGYMGAFEAAVEQLGLRGKTLGVDSATMRVFEWLAFQETDPTMLLVEADEAMVGMRAHKQPAEIEAMRRAVRISEAALEQVIAQVRVGMTEQEIAGMMVLAQREAGATGLAFDPLVQSGPNSANPHGFVTDRAVGQGEILLIDFGCEVEGYVCDITRTFVVGEPTDEMRRMHDAVLRANTAARALIKPGVMMGDLDKAARDIIEAAGYGDYFTHRTGHGLGLDPHETTPQIAMGVEDLLEAGMTFTIEPGIYLPGVGGIRIEDNVLVTETGGETLTSFGRGLQIISHASNTGG